MLYNYAPFPSIVTLSLVLSAAHGAAKHDGAFT